MKFAILLLSCLSFADTENFAPAIISGIENILYESIMCQKIPGLSVAIVEMDPDSKIFAKGYGSKKLSNLPTEEVTDKTPFCIGDLTKGFTSILIGKLKESFLLEFDEKLTSLIPEFRGTEQKTCLTVRDILTMKSAVSAYSGLEDIGFPFETPEELMKAVVEFGLTNRTFNYNDVLYTLLGRAAALLFPDNTTWEGLLQKFVIKPLNMANTVPISVVKDLESDRFPESAVFQNNHPFKVPPGLLRLILPNAPGRSLCSSATDIANYLVFLLSKTSQTPSGQKIIKAETLKELWTPVNELYLSLGNETKINGYGMSWAVGSFFDELLIYHFGSIFGFKSVLYLLPERNIGVYISMSGSLNGTLTVPNTIAQNILGILLENRVPLIANQVCEILPQNQTISDTCRCKTPANTWQLIGSYRNPALGQLNIHSKDDSDPYTLRIVGQYLEITYGRNGVAKICADENERLWLQYHRPMSLFFPTCPPSGGNGIPRTVDDLLRYPENRIEFRSRPNSTVIDFVLAYFIQDDPPIFHRISNAPISTTTEPNTAHLLSFSTFLLLILTLFHVQ